ncbi:MAG: hypothetical protein V1644_01365, partial [Candidatus Micrarchaeota archaeon]
MRLTAFVLVFFVSFLLVSAVAPLSDDYFTRHSDLGGFMALDFGGQGNFYVNDFQEPELFFNSIFSQGVIEVKPLVGNEVLIRNAKVFKINANGEIEEDLGVALDGEPIVTVEVPSDSNALVLDYNSLSFECGGNYALSFNALNPVDPGNEKNVVLRFHIPCQTDLLVILSEQMGSPTAKFLSTLRTYIETVAGEGKTVRVESLPRSLVNVDFMQGTKVIDKDVVITAGEITQLDEDLGISVVNSPVLWGSNVRTAGEYHFKIIEQSGDIAHLADRKSYDEKPRVYEATFYSPIS